MKNACRKSALRRALEGMFRRQRTILTDAGRPEPVMANDNRPRDTPYAHSRTVAPVRCSRPGRRGGAFRHQSPANGPPRDMRDVRRPWTPPGETGTTRCIGDTRAEPAVAVAARRRSAGGRVPAAAVPRIVPAIRNMALFLRHSSRPGRTGKMTARSFHWPSCGRRSGTSGRAGRRQRKGDRDMNACSTGSTRACAGTPGADAVRRRSASRLRMLVAIIGVAGQGSTTGAL